MKKKNPFYIHKENTNVKLVDTNVNINPHNIIHMNVKCVDMKLELELELRIVQTPNFRFSVRG